MDTRQWEARETARTDAAPDIEASGRSDPSHRECRPGTVAEIVWAANCHRFRERHRDGGRDENATPFRATLDIASGASKGQSIPYLESPPGIEPDLRFREDTNHSTLLNQPYIADVIPCGPVGSGSRFLVGERHHRGSLRAVMTASGGSGIPIADGNGDEFVSDSATQCMAGSRMERSRLCIERRTGDPCVGEDTKSFDIVVDNTGGFDKVHLASHPRSGAAPTGVCVLERFREPLKCTARSAAPTHRSDGTR